MAETITPVVYGGRRRWVGALALHVVGASLAAAVFGAVLGLVGGLLGLDTTRAGLVTLAVLAVVYAAGMVPWIRVPVPQLRRQVPDWWRTFFSPPVTAFLYGAGLGVGFFTVLATGALVVVSAAALVSGSALVAAALLLPFGVARGASAIVAANVTTIADGPRLIDRLTSRSELGRRAAGFATLALVAGFALVEAAAAAGGWAVLASAAVAGTFAWAGVAKLADHRRWRRTLAAHRLPAQVERTAVWAVPTAELVVPALALLGARTASGVWALALLAGFSVEVVRARRIAGGAVACGCFGGRSAVGAPTLLVRNAVLSGLAIVGTFAPDAWLLRLPGFPGDQEIVPFALALVELAVVSLVVWRASVWLSKGRTR